MIHCGNRRPDDRAVAVLAHVGGLHMRRAFAGGLRAVMTAETVVDDVGVIERRRRPRNRRMAVVAIVAAVDMCRVFAGRNHTVVTGAAGAKYLGVVDRKDRDPYVRCMTVFADIARLNMCLILARGVRTVMAAGTVTRDVDVIEICRQPASCRMTVVTVIATVDVILVLATRDHAIVAGSAGPDHLCVINRVNGSPDV